jgi:hypothetical protein
MKHHAGALSILFVLSTAAAGPAHASTILYSFSFGSGPDIVTGEMTVAPFAFSKTFRDTFSPTANAAIMDVRLTSVPVRLNSVLGKAGGMTLDGNATTQSPWHTNYWTVVNGSIVSGSYRRQLQCTLDCIVFDLGYNQGSGNGLYFAAFSLFPGGVVEQETISGALTLTPITAIPEPATVTLLTMGLAGAALRGRRRIVHAVQARIRRAAD